MSKRKMLHPKMLILIGGSIGIIGIYASSYADSNTFMILFPAAYGIAVGFTIMQV